MGNSPRSHSKKISDRRRHTMLVTKFSEYHCRDDECVGVRDLLTGKWCRFHGALRGRLVGSIGTGDEKLHRELRVGNRLLFLGGDQPMLTSRLIEACRPPKDALFYYASLCRAGEIRVR
jgi:hypothetical protein